MASKKTAANNQKRFGKAQARKEFAALVETVASGAGPIEITDYGKVAAVLLSEEEYRWLLTRAQQNVIPKKELRGFFTFTDDLETLSKEVAADIEKSIKKTEREL